MNRWSESHEKPEYRAFAHEVPLRPEHFFTIQTRGSLGESIGPYRVGGADAGGPIQIREEIAEKIKQHGGFTGVVVRRRPLNTLSRLKMSLVTDEYFRWPNKLADVKYDIVIAFPNEAEAVMFKLIFG